jgi:hypothetical protein
VPGAGHGGMAGQAVRGRRLVVPVMSLSDESGPELDEAVVRAATSDEVGGCPQVRRVRACRSETAR